MDYNIVPVGENILVKIEEKEKKTKSGIVLINDIKTQTKVAIVMAVGEKVDADRYKPGTKVIIHETAGLEFGEYHFTKHDNIYGILEPKEEEEKEEN